MGGSKFVRRTGAAARKGKGLCIGRMIDTAFTRHVNNVERYSPSNAKHARLGHVVRALAARHIHPVRAQVPVARTDLGIHTTMDAVGVCAGKIVVIELKSTQHTRKVHEQLYDEPSLTRPVLSNGVDASERKLHELQAGFGVVACRRLTPVEVEAIVVVSYKDSAVVHRVPPTMCNSLYFSGAKAAPCGARPAPSRRAAKKKSEPARFDGWPLEDVRVEKLLAGRGVTVVDGHGTRNVVVGSNGERQVLVAGCVRARWSTVRGNKRKDLLRALLKTHTDVYGRCDGAAQTYVLAPYQRTWRLHRVDPQQ